MKTMNVGQRVQTSSGRIGVVKGMRNASGTEVIVWFTEDGTDTGYFSVASLTKLPNE